MEEKRLKSAEDVFQRHISKIPGYQFDAASEWDKSKYEWKRNVYFQVDESRFGRAVFTVHFDGNEAVQEHLTIIDGFVPALGYYYGH